MRAAGFLVPVAGFLAHGLARFEDRRLAFRLVLQGPGQRAQRVHVLDLGAGAELLGAGGAQRDVGVDPQRSFFHLHVGDADGLEHAAELGDVGPGVLGGAEVGLAHDLQQRHPGPVVVDQAVVGAVHPAASPADVRRLAGIFFEVGPLDADPLVAHLQPPVAADRLVVLRDLVVLRHVGIEVVLPVEDRLAGHVAVERLPHPQGELHGPLVEHRQ